MKQALLVCGHQTSQLGKDVLKELQTLKYLEAVVLGRKHVGLAPFEEGGEVPLEGLCSKYNCGLFVVANHTKSKPHNLVFGRCFDHRIYDMVEVGITQFDSMQSISAPSSFIQGTKPCFVFLGEKFETEAKMKLLKSVFLDFFRGREVQNVEFEGLQRLLVLTAADSERLYLRQFKVAPQKQATAKTALDGFVEVGPRLDLVMRRVRQAPRELQSGAFPKVPVQKRAKNVQLDSLQNKVGSVYVPSQAIDSVITSRHKGLKRQRRVEREAKRQKTRMQ